MLGDNLPHRCLEVQWALLHLGLEFAVDEDAVVEVLLRVYAEVFVFRHDAFVRLVYEVKVFDGGGLVAVDFVFYGTVCGGVWDEALHGEEVGSAWLAQA